MKITKAKIDDIKEIAKIEINSGYEFRKDAKLNEEYKRINEEFKTKEFFIVKNKNTKLVGYISFKIKNRECKLDYLSVIKSFHGKGVGKKLMRFVENYAKKKNCRKIEFEVNNKNFRAIGLYNQLRYYVVSVKEKINYGKKVVKLKMEKELA